MKRRLLTALAALTVIPAMATPVGATGAAFQSGPDSDDTVRTDTALGARADSDKLQYRAAEVTPMKTDPLAGAEDGIFIVRLENAPVTTYRGEVGGFVATSPEAVGNRKLNADSAAVRAYVGFLEDRQAAALDRIGGELQRPVGTVHSYSFAANGFALDLTVEEARAISRLPGVESVRPDVLRQLATDYGPAWIGAPGLWGTDCGDHCGEGILVGVLDTGINPENPSFAEVGPNDGHVHANPFGADTFVGVCDPADDSHDPTFVCNDKLVGAWSFLDYPNSSPIDDNGHGSHTASTAAGNFVDAVVEAPTLDIFPTLSGVAPHANLIMYDVCDKDGCPLSVIVAGIDQAIADGVDVINYSIGGGAVDPWSEDDAIGFLQARAAGIFVATSAGNDGPDPETVGGPADAPWMTSVAAQTHNRDYVNSLINMTGGDTPPPADIEGLGFTSGHGPAEIVYAGDVPSTETDTPELCGVGSLGDFDSPWDPGTFSGEIVVCDRGTFGRVEKGANVLAAGAGGYVLADDGGGLVSDPHELPGVHITQSDGDALKAWLATGTGHTATIFGATQSVADANADILAGFSSRGPNPTNETLSPDVSAPGVGIIAAHGTGGDTVWTFLSGTSMAGPHVAGAAALLMQSTDWTPAQIESALMMTAYDGVLDTDGSPATWLEQGAGRVRVDLAMASGLLIDETSGDFADADPAVGGDPKALNIASVTSHECVNECSWTRTVEATMAGSWSVAAVASDFNLSVSPTNFSLAGGETQEVTITADVRASVQEVFLFGEINITGDGPDLHIPVTVQPRRGDLPDLVEIWTRRDTGSVVVEDVTAVEITWLTIEHSGLSKATKQMLELSEDSARNSPYDDLDDGVFVATVDVAPDQWRLVAETFDSTAPDVDLFVGTGDTPSEGTEMCSSTTPSGTEHCNVWDPAPGTWWILVQNWDGVEAPATDTLMLSYGTAGADEDNMLVAGPPDRPELEPFDLRIYWDLADAEGDDRHYGAFSLGTDPDNPGFVGRAPVDLIRHPDDVVKTADDDNPFPGETVEFTITINPNVTHQDLTYEIVDHVPDGLTYVPRSATGGLELRSDGALVWTGTMPSDVQVPELPAHVLTYEATVDGGTGGTFVTNTAWHVTDNIGDEQAAAGVEIGLGDVTAPVWNGAELTVHDKLSDSLMLEWGAAMDNVAVFAYDVYVNGGRAGTVGPTTFDFHVDGLVPQSLNEFAVIARDAIGNESVSLEANATMATDFIDDDFSIFEDDIEWMSGRRLTFGCDPPANTMFCPDDNMTRGQLAAFITRALDLPPGPDAFDDDDGHVFEGDIDAIAAAGIAHDCGVDRYCPDAYATRAQLAAMFKEAFGLPDTATDFASDDDGHRFEDAINSMYATSITFGCGVDLYCPNDPLTRGMASAFFRRAFRWKGWW